MVDCLRFHPPEDDGVLTSSNSVFSSIMSSILLYSIPVDAYKFTKEQNSLIPGAKFRAGRSRLNIGSVQL